MRKKQNKNYGNIKILILLLILFFSGKSIFGYIQANETAKLDKIKKIKQEKISKANIKKLNNKIDNLIIKIKQKSNIEQKEFYNKMLNLLEKYKKTNSNKIYLINIIINRFNIENNKIILKKINFIKNKAQNNNFNKSLILKFTNSSLENNKLIEKYKNNIKNNNSVFIFRKNNNLTKKEIKNISENIKKINPNIILFIDQEGGLINRYTDFESSLEINKYFNKNSKYSFLNNKLKKLDDTKIKIIRNIFPKKYGNFPSLELIGKTYDKFGNKKEAKIFLDIIAFIRFQSLKESGINSYGLVLDLNRGNPVISGNKRSFSKHLWKYKILVDSFIKAGKNTEILIYAKHFPGHGAGNIDSHKGVLNLVKYSKYLGENLELFDYFLTNSGKLQTGLMVAHIYFSEKLNSQFNKIIDKADFIITDDLAMQGYKLAHNNKIKNLVFSTDQIINKNNTIIVDTVNIAKIK